jgi:subtilisin-like proprotein convertase family protein
MGRAETPMNAKRSRVALWATAALTLLAIAGMTPGAAEAKKKKGKTGGTADITKQVNAAIPDATATTNGMLTSTIDIGGKKFKGTRVRDVNVTLQTSGAAANSVDDLDARLSAPNGATSWLFNALNGQSLGPLTLDDQSPNFLDGLPPTYTPTALPSPYVGTAQPDCLEAFGGCPLAVMNDGPASGTWTLRIYDDSTGGGNTSTLLFWRLTVVAGKPYKTK